MIAGRRVVAVVAIGLMAAVLPAYPAQAKGDVGTCALPTGCAELPAPDGVADVVDETTGGVTKVIDGAKEVVDDGSGGATQPITDPIVDEITDTLDLTPGGEGDHAKPPAGKHRKKKGGSVGSTTGGIAAGDAAPLADRLHAFEALAAREARRSLDGRLDRTVSFVSSPEPGLAERLRQAALDAAKAFTFPAILIALVVGFVTVQSRIDHKDPKLALAAVSSEQEYLSFT